MITFDDLTLAEVEEISNTAMGGKPFGDPTADPMLLAGAVLWMAKRREQPGLEWQAFKASVSMREIKEFSLSMQEQEANPLSVTNGSVS